MEFIGDNDSYEYYAGLMNSNRWPKLSFSNLETALPSDSRAVLLHNDLLNRSACMLMLLEQGKDILSPYPLARNLEEFTNIAEFRHAYTRIISMINPLEFYPSTTLLAEIIEQKDVRLGMVRINCHPVDLGGDFSIAGREEGILAGSAQAIVQMLVRITGTFPENLVAGADSAGELQGFRLGFPGFDCMIRFDQSMQGWIMELSGELPSGESFSAVMDYTGMLALRNEIKPRIEADPDVMENAIRANMEDFINAVRHRRDPLVDHIDGLSSIILNNAIIESLEKGSMIGL
jgi:hypothetical protein